MSLFDTYTRDDARLKQPFEGSFDFYNRVDDAYWSEVRAALEAWFGDYPRQEQEDLRRRLYSEDERASQAAFWELLLHTLYLRAGFTVEVHPELPDTQRHPDFLMGRGSTEFLMEGRSVTGETDAQYQRDTRRRAIYSAINHARPEAFYVRLEILADGPTPPKVRAITSHITTWLAKLDPSVVEQQLHGAMTLENLPSTDFADKGWHLRFSAIPVKADRRGKLSGPMLGIGPVQTLVSDPLRSVRAALKAKGSRYGRPELPLVIALDVEELAVHDEDVVSALYGSTVSEISSGNPPVVIREYRKADGSFNPRSGSRVSAVLAVKAPRPWLAPRLRPRLYLNPWATHEYSGDRLWETVNMDPATGQFEIAAATTRCATLLGLDEEWPPGEPFK